MNPASVAKIAVREYLSRVRNRAFITMTIFVPAVFAASAFLVPILARTGARDVRVAVLDAADGLGTTLAERLSAVERPRIAVTEVVEIASSDAAARERFTGAVRNRGIDGYVLLERQESAPAGLAVRYFTRGSEGQDFMRELRLAAQAIALDARLADTGVDVEEIRRIQRLGVESVTLWADGERAGGFERALITTMAMAMLLYVAVLINGQGMATAIVEEKSSRLIEVILAAVTATEFMTGKILGVLGSGLTQLAIWVAVGILVIVQALPALAMGSAAAGLELADVLAPRVLLYFVLFFSLGYLLYSVLFAVVAVTCTTTEELGQSMFISILPMVVALMAAMSIISNPNTTLAQVLSLIPLFAPLVMLARVNLLMPPLWEVWLSIALMIAAVGAAAWVAARVFQYALLMTGKRPTLPELLRVVRAG
jgi:ABC-2 type transport system permease protein